MSRASKIEVTLPAPPDCRPTTERANATSPTASQITGAVDG